MTQEPQTPEEAVEPPAFDPEDTEAIALHMVAAAIEKKALDIVMIDVRERSSYADFVLVCTARNDRHVVAIANHIESDLRPFKVRPLGVEGKQYGQWVLMDFADVVIHIFYGPFRRVYEIDQLWADAPRVDLELPDDLRAEESLYEGYELD